MMSNSRSSYWVLIASLTLTGLLAGAVIAGLGVRGVWQRQLADAEFLRKQLERLEGQGGPAPGPPPALVRVATAQEKKVQPQRSIIGWLVEVRKVTVASEVTGKFTQSLVQEGSVVVPG